MRDPKYDILFEPVPIGPLMAKNRFFQVPHCNGMGYRDPVACAEMRAVKAQGGWAVVCTEEAEIHYTSEVTPYVEARIWDDSDIPALARMTERVHDCGALAGRITVDETMCRDGIDRDEIEAVLAELGEIPDLWDFVPGTWEDDSVTSRFSAEAHEEQWVRGLKALTSKPVVGVGRFTSPDTMVRMIRQGILDFIGAARPSIADPYLPAKIEEGRIEDIRECIGCNICVSGDFTMSPIRCTQNPSMGEEWRRGWHPERYRPRHADDDHYYMGGVLAELLQAEGYEVVLVTREPLVSAWTVNTMEQHRIQARLMETGVELRTSTGVSAVLDRELLTECAFTERQSRIAADTVLLVTARLPVDGLCRELLVRRGEWADHGLQSVRAVGDALAPGTIAGAVWEGRRYAEELEAPTDDSDITPLPPRNRRPDPLNRRPARGAISSCGRLRPQGHNRCSDDSPDFLRCRHIRCAGYRASPVVRDLERSIQWPLACRRRVNSHTHYRSVCMGYHLPYSRRVYSCNMAGTSGGIRGNRFSRGRQSRAVSG